jgi:hypothetical protein
MAYKQEEATMLRQYFDDHKQELHQMMPIKIDAGQTISDLDTFLDTQFSIMASTSNYAIADPCYQRLVRIKQLLEDA